MISIEHLERLHGVSLPSTRWTEWEKCQHIAENSRRRMYCEPYWLQYTLEIARQQRQRADFEFIPNPVDIIQRAIAQDFDGTTLHGVSLERDFTILNDRYEVSIINPDVIALPDGRIDNLQMNQFVADQLRVSVEQVICVHAAESFRRQKLRQGVMVYLRREASCGTYVQIVSASPPELLAAQIDRRGYDIEWQNPNRETLSFDQITIDSIPVLVLPERKIQLVGRHLDSRLPKPSPHIHRWAFELSGFRPENYVAFEDTLSGECAATSSGIRYVVGVDATIRNFPAVYYIQDFAGFSPSKVNDILLGNRRQ